jgi:hypothetical protein
MGTRLMPALHAYQGKVQAKAAPDHSDSREVAVALLDGRLDGRDQGVAQRRTPSLRAVLVTGG